MLTDTLIRHTKPAARPLKLSDGGGLHLLIQPHGSRLWRLNYRFAGKQRTLALGQYPVTGLRDARDRRDAAKRLLSLGSDPGVVRKAEKKAGVDAAANTFQAVAAEWLDRKLVKEYRAAATLERVRRFLRSLNDDIGDRPIDEIEAPELLEALRKTEARGHHETANRLRATASQVFRYGLATGKCKRDPAADLRGALTAATAIARPAILEPAAIGQLMRAIDTFDGNPVTGLALRLLALTFVRPGELRFAEWSEINTAAAVWIIPAPKMKMRVAHRVPLSRQALEVLQAVPNLGSRFVFSHSMNKELHENTMNHALRRIGYAGDVMVGHGFRAMASTCLNEMGTWSHDVIERQLAHLDRNAIRRAYNRAEHWPERVEMMQAWADHLDRLAQKQ